MAKLQAFIAAVEPINDAQIRVQAKVTDGVLSAIIEVDTDSIETLKSRCARTLDAIGSAALLKALTPGQVLDLTPKPPDPLPPDQQALHDFLSSLGALESALRKVASGVIKADDADLAALLKTTQVLYLPEFIGQG